MGLSLLEGRPASSWPAVPRLAESPGSLLIKWPLCACLPPVQLWAGTQGQLTSSTGDTDVPADPGMGEGRAFYTRPFAEGGAESFKIRALGSARDVVSATLTRLCWRGRETALWMEPLPEVTASAFDAFCIPFKALFRHCPQRISSLMWIIWLQQRDRQLAEGREPRSFVTWGRWQVRRRVEHPIPNRSSSSLGA